MHICYFEVPWPQQVNFHRRLVKILFKNAVVEFRKILIYKTYEGVKALVVSYIVLTDHTYTLGRDVDIWGKLCYALTETVVVYYVSLGGNGSWLIGCLTAHQHMKVISAWGRFVSHSLRSTPTNGVRSTVLGLPWRSPIQGVTEVFRLLLAAWRPISRQRRPSFGNRALATPSNLIFLQKEFNMRII